MKWFRDFSPGSKVLERSVLTVTKQPDLCVTVRHAREKYGLSVRPNGTNNVLTELIAAYVEMTHARCNLVEVGMTPHFEFLIDQRGQ
jgi:hypothetical protein